MFKKIFCAATLLCAASMSNAATVSYTSAVTMAPTNYNVTFGVQQFNPVFGVLNSVTFTLEGTVLGDARAENEDPVPQDVTLDLTAIETLSHTTTGAELVVTIPLISSTIALDGYDGMTDFMGASGVTLGGISATESETNTFTTEPLLSFFTGLGLENVTLDAIAASIASGPGNITSSFRTSAAARITVTYDYDDLTTAVSAPSSIALLGLSILAFVGFRKVRK